MRYLILASTGFYGLIFKTVTSYQLLPYRPGIAAEIAIRFMDEYDLDFRDLVRGVEKIRSSCQDE